MTNWVDELIRLAPPPRTPISAGGDWAGAERSLGTTLPSDFKQLVATYGRGRLCDHLVWFDPFSDQPSTTDEVAEFLRYYDADLREEFPDACPWPPHPAEGGLLPWAFGADEEVLCWITEGIPDRWPVVAADLRLVQFGDGPETSVHRTGAVEFLVGWVSGTLGDAAVSPWPRLEPGAGAFFRPTTE